MSHRLTIKGQVTIPKEIRDFLGLQEGNSSVEFVVGDDGQVTVRKASADEEKARHASSVRTRSIATAAPRIIRYADNVPPARRATGGVLALLAGGF